MYTNPTSKLHSLSGEYLDFTMFWIFFGILLLIIFLQSEDWTIMEDYKEKILQLVLLLDILTKSKIEVVGGAKKGFEEQIIKNWPIDQYY